MSSINHPIVVCLPIEDVRLMERAFSLLILEAANRHADPALLDVAAGWVERMENALRDYKTATPTRNKPEAEW